MSAARSFGSTALVIAGVFAAFACASEEATETPAEEGGGGTGGAGAGGGTGGTGGTGGSSEAAAGDPCTAPADCGEALVCIVIPGELAGRCMEPCTTPGRICASGAVCSPFSGGGGICWIGGTLAAGESCTDGAQCGVGLSCVGDGTTPSHCVRACNTLDAAGCLGDEFCQEFQGETAGYCVLGPALGAACDSPADCAGATDSCLSEADTMGLFPFGMCTQPCMDDAACGPGNHCRALQEGANAFCFRGCVAQGDCRVIDGWACVDAATCAASSHAQECGAFRGGESLCAPAALFPPDGGGGAGCGDGTVDGTEKCDDGNTSDGDACSADCMHEFISISGSVQLNPIVARYNAANGLAAPSVGGLAIRIVDPIKALSGSPAATLASGVSAADGTFSFPSVETTSVSLGIVVTIDDAAGDVLATSTMGVCQPGATGLPDCSTDVTGFGAFVVTKAFVEALQTSLHPEPAFYVEGDGGEGFVLGGVMDTSGVPVGGATVASPGLNLAFFDAALADTGAELTDASTGAFAVKPEGIKTLTASKAGTTFLNSAATVGESVGVVFQLFFLVPAR